MQASELSAVTGEFLVLPEAWGDMTRWHQRMGEVRRAAPVVGVPVVRSSTASGSGIGQSAQDTTNDET